MTADAFLEWETRQDEKHEFYRGEVFAMVGGSATHARIISRAFAALLNATRGRNCEVFTEAMRVRVEAVDLST